MTEANVLRHRIAGKLTASELIEVSLYCTRRRIKFRFDGRVDHANPRRPRPVKLWFSDEKTAEHFAERFAG